MQSQHIQQHNTGLPSSELHASSTAIPDESAHALLFRSLLVALLSAARLAHTPRSGTCCALLVVLLAAEVPGSCLSLQIQQSCGSDCCRCAKLFRK